MLTKTKGIVFNYIKYKETSIIVKIFTLEYGVQSYIVNGVRTKGKLNKITLYQPLSILDLVVYSNKKTDLHRISEVQFDYKYQTIPFDVKKSAMSLFLAECFNKMMMEQEQNQPLYKFLETSLMYFDQLDTDYSDFHIYILIKLLEYLGHSIPLDLETESGKQLQEIKNNKTSSTLNRTIRTELLEFILKFYSDNSQLKINLKSKSVLEAVFD